MSANIRATPKMAKMQAFGEVFTRALPSESAEPILTIGPLKYRSRTSIPGIGPCPGSQEWKLSSPEGAVLKQGYGFIVEKTDGTPGNFLILNGPSGPMQTEEFLIGYPLYGQVVVFQKSAEAADPLRPVIVTLDWKTALLLYRATGYRTVACLFYENVQGVLAALVEREPQRRFLLCFNGHGEEGDNPKLRSLFDVPKNANIGIVPSGEKMTFDAIFKTKGHQALRSHILKFSHKVQHPWPGTSGEASLRMDMPANPWPGQIHGVYAVESLMALIRRFAALDEDAILMICLWVIFTYAIDGFSYSPILALSSPEAGCGKTTLFILLKNLCSKAYGTELISSAQLKELLNQRAKSVFLDEAQDVFGKRDFVSMLSSSHSRLGLGVTRGWKTDMKSGHFFRATALAYRDADLPDKLITRSVPIRMQRRAPDEIVGSHQELRTAQESGQLIVIKAQITRWVDDNIENFKALMPPKLPINSDRANDTYGPLLSIARALGAEYLARATDIAKTYYTGEEAKNPSRILLANIRTELGNDSMMKIGSAELAARLTAEKTSIWGTFDKGKPLNATLMARMLGEYGVTSMNLREGEKVFKGYHLKDFQDAFERYLPEEDETEDD